MRTIYLILVLIVLFIGYKVALQATDTVAQIKQVQASRLASIN